MPDIGVVPAVDELNALTADVFATAVAPLFEGAPRFLAALAGARPFASEDELLDVARSVARELPEEAQVELLNAHPRIGADPASVSRLSRSEQGYDAPPRDGRDEAWVAEELAALNDAYESRFGFRFVVFVAGRRRADIVPILERALRADRTEELRRGLDDIVFIAGDRLAAMRGPAPLDETLREAIALEASMAMLGEADRETLVLDARRLVADGVESHALLQLSLADPSDTALVDARLDALLREIGLVGWTREQAVELLVLHAAASIVSGVNPPIDGARRIAALGGPAPFPDLIARWESAPERSDEIDEEIRRAAADLVGPEMEGP